MYERLEFNKQNFVEKIIECLYVVFAFHFKNLFTSVILVSARKETFIKSIARPTIRECRGWKYPLQLYGKKRSFDYMSDPESRVIVCK